MITVALPEQHIRTIIGDVKASSTRIEEQKKQDEEIVQVLSHALENGGEGTTFTQYQKLTEQTAIYPDDTIEVETDTGSREVGIGTIYTALGLVGESGEVAEKVKKFVRDGNEKYLHDIQDELGDVLWYQARLSDELGLNLSDVADRNLDKLLDRQNRRQLTGEGDDR